MLTIRLGRSMTMVMLAAALLATACGDDDGTTTAETGAETGADDGPSTAAPTTGDETNAETATASDTGCAELPQLHVVNGTGNAVEEITMTACDTSEQSSFPVPPGGLPDGGDLTIDLPGPGCWVLEYAGEGCFGDPPGMVEAACGETVEWALSPESHVCAGH